MKDEQQKTRLQKFWGTTVFSLGVLWGVCNLVYLPIAAVTSIPGSSWLEGSLVVAAGVVTFAASAGAFYRRRISSRILLVTGIGILVTALVSFIDFPQDANGAVNRLLMIQAGAAPIFLGIFGEIIEKRRWPNLSDNIQGKK